MNYNMLVMNICFAKMGYLKHADSSFVPPLVYAMLGSSRDLAVGTVAVASLLISSLLGKEVSPYENPTLYLQLAFTATFFAGIFQALLGILRSVVLLSISLKMKIVRFIIKILLH